MMWRNCMYCCGPYALTASIVLFIFAGMLRNGSWTFEVLAAKHSWDVAEKARCCTAAAIFYLVVSLALILLSLIDSYVIDVEELFCSCTASGRRRRRRRGTLWDRCQRNGYRATFRDLWLRLKRSALSVRCCPRRGWRWPGAAGAGGGRHAADDVAVSGLSRGSSFAGQAVLPHAEAEARAAQQQRPSVKTDDDDGVAMHSLTFASSPHSPAVAKSASMLFKSSTTASPPRERIAAAAVESSASAPLPSAADVSGPAPREQEQEEEEEEGKPN